MALHRIEQDSEQKLIRKIQQGDTSASRLLYDRYVRYLAAIVSRYITHDEDVKDVLQESFLKIFSSIDTFQYKGPGSIKGWMAKIALNETLKQIRKNSKMEFSELSGNEMEKPDDEPETENIPTSEIYRMIRELPDGYRTIFNLYAIDGKSHKEIAALLNIKESSSASQLHRAKAILANKIKRYRTGNSTSV